MARGAIAAEILGDLVAELAILHPADGEEIHEGPQGAIANPVLRHAEPARPVIDRHLDHAEAPDPEQRGNEAVESAIEHEVSQALATERSEGAAAVLDRLLTQRIAHLVGDARGELPDP